MAQLPFGRSSKTTRCARAWRQPTGDWPLAESPRLPFACQRQRVEWPAHPERNAQFEHIIEQRSKHLAAAQPVISVDTKKKELIGDFKNAGRTWSQSPELVNVHDFAQDALGKAVPYGIYDVQHNQGTVYVGQSADTPTFAVANIAQWCATERLERFPQATELLIEADGGGSNAARSRVWKQQLQEKVADRFAPTYLPLHVNFS